MLIFLDTEFTQFGDNAALLSVGLVSLDGKLEFYAERSDVPEEECSMFVVDTVLPLFGTVPGAQCTFPELRGRLVAFLSTIPEPVQLGCDLQTDIRLLQDCLGNAWPPQVSRKRVKLDDLSDIEVCVAAADRYFKGFPRHHALNDAHALRLSYLENTRKGTERRHQ